MRYGMALQQLICSIFTIYVHCRCRNSISLNVKFFFIGSKLHTYQNISTKNSHAGVCYLIRESPIEIHIPGSRWRFQTLQGFPFLFIVHKRTYNTQMSLYLRIHNWRIQATKFRQLQVCVSNVTFDIVEVLLRSNLAQVKCPVSSTVDLSQ